MKGIREYESLEKERKQLENRLKEIKDPLYYKDVPTQVIYSHSSGYTDWDDRGPYEYSIHHYIQITTKYDKSEGFTKKNNLENLDYKISETIQKVYAGDILQIRTKNDKNPYDLEYALFMSIAPTTKLNSDNIRKNINEQLNGRYSVLELKIQTDEQKKEEAKVKPDKAIVIPANQVIPEYKCQIFYMRIVDILKKQETDTLEREKEIEAIELQSQNLEKQKQELNAKLNQLKKSQNP